MIKLLSFYILTFALGSCITNSGPNSEESTVPKGGCCKGFLTSPETPFWYQNLEGIELSDAKDLCESVDGKWESSDCSTAGMVGGCSYQDTVIPYIQLYPESQFDHASSKDLSLSECPPDTGVQWITEFK